MAFALIAYAKTNPGKLSLASFRTGSISHLAGELFKMTSGVDMIQVPYRGGGVRKGQDRSGFIHLLKSLTRG